MTETRRREEREQNVSLDNSIIFKKFEIDFNWNKLQKKSKILNQIKRV